MFALVDARNRLTDQAVSYPVELPGRWSLHDVESALSEERTVWVTRLFLGPERVARNVGFDFDGTVRVVLRGRGLVLRRSTTDALRPWDGPRIVRVGSET